MGKPTFAFVLAAIFVSIFASEASRAQEAVAPPSDDSYKIAPGDVLDVTVWKEEDLSRKTAVGPDGYLHYPLVGSIHAAGRPVGEIRDEIQEKLKPYITEPVVSVGIDKLQGNAVFVIGKVTSPGRYVVPRQIDVLQALSLAGGLTPFADQSDIKILRRVGSTVQVFEFDYDEVIGGDNLKQNMILQPGDTVAVP